MESGTDATQDLSFWTDSYNAASDCTVANTGSCSIKFNSGATQDYSTVSQANAVTDAGSRISFYIKFDAFLSGDGDIIELWDNTNANDVWNLLGVSSSKNLNCGQSTGSTVLNTGTWYKISVAYTISSAGVNQCKLYLNGNLEVTGSNDTNATTGSNYMRLGMLNNSGGANIVQHIDDVSVDNGSDLSDPGNILVTAKRPNANGANNQFTTEIGSGGSGYGTGHSSQVNERPLNTANGWRTSSGSKSENYAIEGASTGDVDVSSATLVGSGA